MLSPAEAKSWPITAGFRARPEHTGSIHDDESARAYGYRSALVPGIVLYGYLSDIVVRSWGLDWVARGTMRSRSRRPVYVGDRLTIVAAPVQEDAAGRSVEMEIRDADGNVVAVGGATLPNAAPPIPDAADFPVRPMAEPLPRIEPGGFEPGMRFGCSPRTPTPDDLAEFLGMYGQQWPVHAAEGILPGVYYPFVATRNALDSYDLPTPSIFVSAATRHLGVGRVGTEVTTSGLVTASYERKGNYYTDQRHLVFADGKPIAVVERTSIYAARKER